MSENKFSLPDPQKAWDYENGFFLTASPDRLAKIIVHYELYKLIQNVHGAIVECGVFKGASFVRWAMLKKIFNDHRQLIGFDTFGEYPETQNEDDKSKRERFIQEAGDKSSDIDALLAILVRLDVAKEVLLCRGDICKRVPAVVKEEPEFQHLQIALLHVDVDIYEPTVTILDHLWPKVMPGGIMVLDDYGVFPGETRAVDEYFQQIPQEMYSGIQGFPFRKTPVYVKKTAEFYNLKK